jgi:hypothetical protein
MFADTKDVFTKKLDSFWKGSIETENGLSSGSSCHSRFKNDPLAGEN